jgi:dipeptidase E
MPKKIIIAIGGGEMGRTKILDNGSIKQYPIETMHIDEKIVKYTNKSNPSLLVIGTASKDDNSYYETVKNHYSKNLKCNISRLDITKNNYTKQQLENIVFNYDIVYISGGDTKYMLQEWQKVGLNDVLINAYNKGIVIAGFSAGALCWFDYYDNFDYVNEPNFKPALLKGLGVIKGFCVVHYDDVSQEKKAILIDLAKEKNCYSYNIKNKEAIIFEQDSSDDVFTFNYIKL